MDRKSGDTDEAKLAWVLNFAPSSRENKTGSILWKYDFKNVYSGKRSLISVCCVLFILERYCLKGVPPMRVAMHTCKAKTSQALEALQCVHGKTWHPDIDPLRVCTMYTSTTCTHCTGSRYRGMLQRPLELIQHDQPIGVCNNDSSILTSCLFLMFWLLLFLNTEVHTRIMKLSHACKVSFWGEYY